MKMVIRIGPNSEIAKLKALGVREREKERNIWAIDTVRERREIDNLRIYTVGTKRGITGKARKN